MMLRLLSLLSLGLFWKHYHRGSSQTGHAGRCRVNFKLMDDSENNNDMMWTEIAKLENPDTSESSGLFGFSLGFDGKTLVVGAPKANGAGNGNEQREVYVL